jgi:cytochrome c peroxidase
MQREHLGKMIFFDEGLSTPPGVSCATCHSPAQGFADPRVEFPTSRGSIPTRFGSRNSPTVAYASFSPTFRFLEGMGPDRMGVWAGGQNWDGVASTLADQAKRPFLSPLEMNDPSEAFVVLKVRQSPYAHLFWRVCGDAADVPAAYGCIAEAIAAYEASREVNSFSSKYDAFLSGAAQLTDQESRGLALFEGKAACARCHPSRPSADGKPPMFTSRHHANVGVPRNPANPFYGLPPFFNPDGDAYRDPGTGGVVGDAAHLGRFKIPTLRNVAVTPPYGHNGVFPDLGAVVHFYNTRDVPGAGWPAPEWDLPSVIRMFGLGSLGLTPDEEADVVAFLGTLTDGWAP